MTNKFLVTNNSGSDITISSLGGLVITDGEVDLDLYDSNLFGISDLIENEELNWFLQSGDLTAKDENSNKIYGSLSKTISGDNFGESFFTDEDTGTRSTSSTSLSSAHIFTTPILPNGLYKIEASFLCRSDSTFKDTLFELSVNKGGQGEKILLGGEVVRFENKESSATQRVPVTVSDIYEGSGSFDIDICFSSEKSSQTTTIYWSRITIWRVR